MLLVNVVLNAAFQEEVLFAVVTVLFAMFRLGDGKDGFLPYLTSSETELILT